MDKYFILPNIFMMLHGIQTYKSFDQKNVAVKLHQYRLTSIRCGKQ